MRKRKVFVTLLMVIVIILSQSSCICSNDQYSLTGGVVSMKPNRDSIKVGDTLLISSFIPKNLLPLNGPSNQTVNYSQALDVTTQFNLYTIPEKNGGTIIGSIDSFFYFTIKGTISNPERIPDITKVVSYVEENDGYHLVFGLEAQKKGIYSFTLIDIFRATKKCTTASIEVLLNNLDNHNYYLNKSYYPGSPYGDTIPAIERTHTYCFKVY